MKKKILAITLSLMLALGLAACGKANEADSTDATPSGSEDSPAGYDSLESWLDSEDKEQTVTAANSQLNVSGLSIEFYAEGENILVIEYSYTTQQNVGSNQSEIYKTFDEKAAPVFSSLVASLFDSFESEYGVVLEDIKLVFRNADGAELYSRYYSEVQG